MVAVQANRLARYLHKVALLQDGGGMTDRQLLGCFLTRGDEAAFAALMGRHGPMVFGVCRRVLRNAHDAEDAFQATFLVLVRKARSIRRPELLGNWLYGVAYRTALAARGATSKRRVKERMMAKLETVEEGSEHELTSLLDQELIQLPEKYRLPIVLCDLEGKTRKEAAWQLGWPEGTINGRLARGRAILAKRLARQGSALSGGAIASVLAQQSASASMPVGLQASTLKAATMVAAGTSAGMVSAKVVALTEGIVKSMLLTKLKIVTALAFLVVMIGIGGTLITGHLPAAQQRQPQREPDPQLSKAAEEKKEPLPQTAKPLKADPTVDDLSKALDISWWKFDLAKTVGAVDIGILEHGRFDLIERYELSERDVPGILKIACQEAGGDYKLVVISNDGRMQMANRKKPAEFSKTNGRGVKNGEHFELMNFKNSTDKGWKYALVIKIIEKPAQ